MDRKTILEAARLGYQLRLREAAASITEISAELGEIDLRSSKTRASSISEHQIGSGAMGQSPSPRGTSSASQMLRAGACR